jgi:hypothetical protein
LNGTATLSDDYSFYTPSFYDRAQNGAQIDGADIPATSWFQLALAGEIQAIASSLGCRCKISDIEAENVRQSWMRDLRVLNIDGGGQPDHFKHAGILAYWLRRRAPIRNFERLTEYDTDVGKYRQATLVGMPSELTAFIIGYDLCRFAEARAVISEKRSVYDFLKANTIDFDFAHDVCVLMKSKHVSPHALMMIYRALFL